MTHNGPTDEFFDDDDRRYAGVFGDNVSYDFGPCQSWNYHFIWCCRAIHWGTIYLTPLTN